ncbi:MAG: PVC-type heme-binding CxxCH protein [Verrucomicrobiales bacterium]|jgi:putative membrane-bound dehydrogenase-like protein
MKPLIPFLCISILASTSSLAQNRGKQHRTSDAPFLTPEQAVAAMDIPENFEVSIYASEPHIGEPIAFTYDGRGRIWVVENYNYVNRRSHKNEQLSRIQIFEDTDSDGTFDTKKLFHDKITFASGIAIGHGGVYLGAPPNLVFIPDANGDDVPDAQPEILLDGWGIQDRHETLNSFIWGPDGWLYGCQGVFTHSLIGKPGATKEERLYLDAGIWRFHPETKEFEIFARGLSNPWGFDFNDLGHGFATCCVIPHLFHIVQGGIYHKQSRPNLNPYTYDPIQTIRDHTHLSAHGGARFYLADTFPSEYRDQLFMCNIHEHAVLVDYMDPNGSSYIGRHGSDFMPTNDLAWVGFSMEIGPDGGVYILDWHDTDICGNDINFPDTGRIYRIMPKGAKRIARPNIPALSDLELCGLQNHPNDWFVRQARTELHHRTVTGKLDKKTVHQALDDFFAKSTSSPKRLRALWAQHVTKRFADDDEQKLIKLLSHSDEHVRAWAIQLLSENKNPPATIKPILGKLAKNDPSPTVRLYLASAAPRLPEKDRLPILAALAQHDEDLNDPNIPRMIWYALEPLVPKHPEAALAVAMNGKIPFLQESVARRMISGSPQDHKKPNQNLRAKWNKTIQSVAPGFSVENVGEGGVIALKSFRNDKVVQTHPLDKKTPCSLKRQLQVPKGKSTLLKIRCSYHPHGDWQLRVLANNKVLHDQIVSFKTVRSEWLEIEIDLTKFAGQKIDLTLENRPNDWAWEFAFWHSVRIVEK